MIAVALTGPFRRKSLDAISRGQLIALLNRYEDILGYREDRQRVEALTDAFDLQPGPAWLLSRIVAANGDLVRADALLGQMPNWTWFRKPARADLDRQMDALRDALGSDCFDTSADGFRLTPMGRLRIQQAAERYSDGST